MTSWKCKARLFLLVLLSTIDLSYGNCMEYFNVDKWTGNITQVITLVEPEDHQDTVECSLERAARENKTSARSYESILYDCFRIVSKQGKPVNLYTEKCKGNTSGTMPFYQFMCLTLAAIKHKYPDVEIEAEQCEYDTTCKFLSGGPSTATPRTLPERTVVTPMKTTTELPPTTNLTQSNGLNQSTTLPLAQPERTTSAVAPKVTQPSSSPPTTATTTTELPPTTINFTHITGLNQSTTLPLAQPERTTSAVPPKVTQPSSSPPTTATTTTELPPTTINFTHITAQPERTTSAVPPKVTQPSSSPPTTATTTTELPQITINSTQSNEKTFSNEKENLALKIFSVISASLNVAALMVFLYQRGSNPRLSHESVATYVTDRASLEAQLVTELKPTELDPISSYSPLTPNGFHVGNEE
ncbi:mucin-2-like isoform X2 [Acanthopagrus latus]|uniref:mucin-2-like isoform X2 n=1 Tax=Acanthopagrus latus TaxID=8177 RepID=UPI00187BDE7E|nr:mucin-2-like isoform X2 [Acanthopagrus latus]